MNHTESLTNKSYQRVLQAICKIIGREISHLYDSGVDGFKNGLHFLGAVLLNQNKSFLLEMIYFLEMNNMKYMMNPEIIDRILKYHLLTPEEIPDRYLDSITCEIMVLPVQLSPSPEIVDYSTSIYLAFTVGFNPFTRGKLCFKPCNDLLKDIFDWRNSISFPIDKKRSQYLGKFLHHYDEVIDLSHLFEV